MKNPEFDTMIKQAGLLLDSAAKELKNPEDDIVTYKACNNSRKSIRKYLTAFLVKRNVQPREPATLADLLEQCKAADPRFYALDMSCVLCRQEPEADNYCLTFEKVNPCLKVAEATRDIVID